MSSSKSALFTSADIDTLPAAKPSQSTTVFIETSVELSKVNQALSTLPNPPLSELESANIDEKPNLYRLEIPQESYLPLQSILHHQFGAKIKFYTGRDADMFYEGRLNKLYAESIHESFTEEDLMMLFGSLGTVTDVKLQEEKSNDGVKRSAFITFEREEDARKALLKVNNLSLGCGVKMHVGLWNENLSKHLREYLDTYQTLNFEEQKKHYQKMLKGRHGGQRTNQRIKPTQNVVLIHMFDVAREQGNRNWESEILSAVAQEVSKFGQLDDSYLIPDAKGRVYLRFQNVQAAELTIQNLNRTWFGDHQIAARFLDDNEFFSMKSIQ